MIESYFEDDNLNYLLEVLQNHAQTNQLLIDYQGKVSQIERCDYYPNEHGVLVFQKSKSWISNGFSVAEMREILEKYCKNIKDIVFELGDNNLQHMINLYESSDNSHIIYYTNILVGSEEDAAKPNYRPLNAPYFDTRYTL